jgi:hypothetical protein
VKCHRHLNITEQDWQAFSRTPRHPRQVRGARPEQQELIDIVESTKEAIVVPELA